MAAFVTMRTLMRVSLVSFVALMALAGHAAARPCHNTEGQARDDLRQAMTFGLSSEALPPLEVAYHGDCTSTCDNEDTPKELEIECWGSFLLVCKGNSSIMATKCEGHYIGVHILEKHMYVGVCEGLVHKFAHWTSRCPKTGASKTRFFARGCLGGSASSVKVLNNSAPESRTVADILASSVTVPSDPRLDALAAELPKAELSGLRGSGDGVVFESRCSGRGGEVFGVKWGERQDVLERSGSPQEIFNALRDVVTDNVGTLPTGLLGKGSDEKPSISTVEPAHSAAQRGSLLSAMVDMVRDDPHPSCTLTCNGRTTWLHGMWPCYGVLEVRCSSPDAHPGARTMSFSGSCKGLWTGALGKMCWGLTQQHSDKTWPSGSAETDAICSGYEGIWSHRKGDSNSGVFAMGQWCKGGAVAHSTVGWHDADGMKVVA